MCVHPSQGCHTWQMLLRARITTVNNTICANAAPEGGCLTWNCFRITHHQCSNQAISSPTIFFWQYSSPELIKVFIFFNIYVDSLFFLLRVWLSSKTLKVEVYLFFQRSIFFLCLNPFNPFGVSLGQIIFLDEQSFSWIMTCN